MNTFKTDKGNTYVQCSIEDMEASMQKAREHMRDFDRELQQLLPGAKWHGNEIELPDTPEARRVIDALTKKYILDFK